MSSYKISNFFDGKEVENVVIYETNEKDGSKANFVYSKKSFKRLKTNDSSRGEYEDKKYNKISLEKKAKLDDGMSNELSSRSIAMNSKKNFERKLNRTSSYNSSNASTSKEIKIGGATPCSDEIILTQRQGEILSRENSSRSFGLLNINAEKFNDQPVKLGKWEVDSKFDSFFKFGDFDRSDESDTCKEATPIDLRNCDSQFNQADLSATIQCIQSKKLINLDEVNLKGEKQFTIDNCAVNSFELALRNSLSISEFNDFGLEEIFSNFLNTFDTGNPRKVTDILEAIILRSSLLSSTLEVFPSDEYGSFQSYDNALLEIGSILYVPSCIDARVGHFVFLAYEENRMSSQPINRKKLWSMKFYRRFDKDIISKLVIVYFTDIFPLGRGDDQQFEWPQWDDMDQNTIATEASFDLLHRTEGRKWFKGGQIYDGFNRAPKGGGFFLKPEKQLSPMYTNYKYLSKTFGFLGILNEVYGGWKSEGAYGAGLGLIKGLTSFGVGELSAMGVVYLLGGAVSTPVVLTAVAAGIIGGYASDSIWENWSYFSSKAKYAGNAIADFLGSFIGSGLDGGSGGPGGIDLRQVPKLMNLHNQKVMMLKRDLHIFFPIDINWAEIAELVNNRILPKGFSILAEDIPLFLLDECLRLTSVNEAPLLFSLHFGANGNSDLYSVMHPSMRKSLIGYIFGFLDYYLKSFLNGGTYTEEFLRLYASNPGVHRKSLRQNVIDIGQELKEVRRKQAFVDTDLPTNYLTLRDLLDGESSQSDSVTKYHSAFRILGDIEKLDYDDSGIFEPKSKFKVESDLNIMPDRIAENIKAVAEGKDMPSTHICIVNSFENMGERVRLDMPKIPRFKGYFELLRIVTFCASFSKTFVDAGMLPPVYDKSVLDLPEFPAVMPPIPIRKHVKFTVSISISEWFNYLLVEPTLQNDRVVLDRIAEFLINTGTLSNENVSDLQTICRRVSRRIIISKISNQSNLLPSSYDEFDDNELAVGKFSSMVEDEGLQYLSLIIFSSVNKLLMEMHAIAEMNEANSPLDQIIKLDKFSEKKLYVLTNFLPKWKEAYTVSKSKKLMEFQKQINDALRKRNVQEENQIQKFRNDMNNQTETAIREMRESYHRQGQEQINKYNKEIDDMLKSGRIYVMAKVNQSRENMINSVNNQVTSLVSSEEQSIRKKAEEYIKETVKKIKDDTADASANYKNQYKDYEIKLNSNLAKYEQDLSSAIATVELKIPSSISFFVNEIKSMTADVIKKLPSRNERLRLPNLALPSSTDFHFGVVGGCGLVSSSITVHKTSKVKTIHSKFLTSRNEQQIRSDGKKYFHMKISLEPSFTHGIWMRARYNQSIHSKSIISSAYQLQSLTNKLYLKDITAKDDCGNTLAHHIVLSNLSNSAELLQTLSLQDCSISRHDGFRPMDIACSAGNVRNVQILLNKGVSCDYILPNGLTPLLLACQANNSKIAILILSSNNYGNIDHSTDTRMTCLHWAIYHNSTALVAELISKKASLIPRRSDSMTPLHLAASMGFATCVEILIYRADIKSVSLLTQDSQNVLHCAVLSNSRESVQLIYDFNPNLFRTMMTQKDQLNLSPLEVAIVYGFNELALDLIELGNVQSLPSIDKDNKEIVDFSLSPFVAFKLKLQPLNSSQFNKVSKTTTTLKELFYATRPSHSQITDKLLSCSNSPTDRKLYLTFALESRNEELLHLVIRVLPSLTIVEQQFLCHVVASEGLHMYIKVLVESGIDIRQPTTADNDETMLDIAIIKDDIKFLKIYWRGVKSINTPYDKQIQMLNVGLITAIKSKSMQSLEYIVVQRQKLIFVANQMKLPIDILEKTNAGKLIESIDVTPNIINVANTLGISFSEMDIISAVKFCRPSVTQSLLAQSCGLIESVRLNMLEESFKCKRMDNMYTIAQSIDSEYSIIQKKLIDSGRNATVATNMISSLSKFSNAINDVRNVINDPITLQSLKYNDKLIVQKFSNFPDTGLLPVYSNYSLYHFLILRRMVHLIPSTLKNYLFVCDDSGFRPIDMIIVLCSKGNENAVFDTFTALIKKVGGIRLSSVLTDELITAIKYFDVTEGVKSFVLLILFDILKKFEENIKNNSSENYLEDVSSTLRFLFDVCNCTVENWNEILSNRSFIQLLPIIVTRRDPKSGSTLLMKAFSKPLARKLVKSILDLPNAKEILLIRDYQNRTALHYCLDLNSYKSNQYFQGLEVAFTTIAMESIKKIISITPELIHSSDRDGITPFMLACSSGFVPCLSYLTSLTTIEALNSGLNCIGEKSLHIAVKSGSINVIKYLILQQNLSPNQQTEAYDDIDNDRDDSSKSSQLAGNTPLHIAAINNNPQAFELLLDLGADPLIRNNMNVTAIHQAVESGDANLWKVLKSHPSTWILAWSGELLINACRNVKAGKEIVNDLLMVVHPNESLSSCIHDKSFTPILVASKYKNASVVSTLIENGCNIKSVDPNRLNAIHYASINNDVTVLGLILRYANVLMNRQECEEFLSQTTLSGDTVIHTAAKHNAMGVIQMFLGIPLITKKLLIVNNDDGLLPSEVAVRHGYREIAILLHLASLSTKVSTIMNDFLKQVSPQELQIAEKELKEIIAETLPLGITANTPNSSKKVNPIDEAEEMFINSLTVDERNSFNSHEAFVSKPLVRTAIVNADTKYYKEIFELTKTVPSYIISLILEYFMIWSPIEDWNDIIDIIKHIQKYWNPYPNQSHVVWLWLKAFMLPRTISSIRSKQIYSELKDFIELSSVGGLHNLPFPGFSQDFIDDKASITTLVSIVKLLKQYANISLSVVMRRLNTYKFSKTSIDNRLDQLKLATSKAIHPKLTSANSHWQVLEAAVIENAGIDGMETVDDIRFISYLKPQERSFIFETILQSLSIDSSSISSIRSWGAVACLYISDLGFEDAEEIRKLIPTDIKKYQFQYLPFLIKCFSTACEIGDSKAVVKVLKNQISNTANFISMKIRELNELVNKSRNLGIDREIDEIIRCFGSTTVMSTFRPHLFSFDGTPVVTLPSAQLNQLREIMTEIENCNVDMLQDNIAIRKACKNAAADFISNPTTKTLGKLLGPLREGFFQATRKKPFRIQCLCVASYMLPYLSVNKESMCQYKGRLGQVATGEGKSIIVSMSAIAHAYCGYNIDVITSTQSLARRDVEEFKELFEFFDISLSTIALSHPTKYDFNAQVLYGTNTDFEFALLREGTEGSEIRMIDPNNNGFWITRKPQIAIVDESDSLLLDAAQNSARIAHPIGISYVWAYEPIFNSVRSIVESNGQLMDETFARIIVCIQLTATSARQILTSHEGGIYKNIVDKLSDTQINRWVLSALSALYMIKNKHYIVRQHKVIIVDLDTGRLQEGSRWSEGIHEMVEVKEHVPISPESGTIASISHPSFFEFYEKLICITGTAGEPEERDETTLVYGIDTFDVPPHRPCLRRRLPTRIYQNVQFKYNAMVAIIKQMYKSRSILVLVSDIDSSIQYSSLLISSGIPHMILNEQQQESEELVIYKAGQLGSVTIATNTAGRGTDIKISKALLAAQGLFVMFGCFPINLRVECQGLGRSGRQGQPGSNQIYISMDEDYVKQLTPSVLKVIPNLMSNFTTEGQLNGQIEEQVVEALYEARTKDIINVSNKRCRLTFLERIRFGTLSYFFSDQKWLKEILSPYNISYQKAYNKIDLNKFELLSSSRLCDNLLEWFKICWTIYFSKISSSQSNLMSYNEIDIVNQKDYKLRNEFIINKSKELYKMFLQESRWFLSLIDKSINLEDMIYNIIIEHGQYASRMDIEKSPVLEAMRL